MRSIWRKDICNVQKHGKTWKRWNKISVTLRKGYKTEYCQKWEVGEDLETFIHGWWKCRLVERFGDWLSILIYQIIPHFFSFSLFLLLTPHLPVLAVVCPNTMEPQWSQKVLSTMFTTLPLTSRTVCTILKNSGYISELINILHTLTS